MKCLLYQKILEYGSIFYDFSESFSQLLSSHFMVLLTSLIGPSLSRSLRHRFSLFHLISTQQRNLCLSVIPKLCLYFSVCSTGLLSSSFLLGNQEINVYSLNNVNHQERGIHEFWQKIPENIGALKYTLFSQVLSPICAENSFFCSYYPCQI